MFFLIMPDEEGWYEHNDEGINYSYAKLGSHKADQSQEVKLSLQR